jgi:hypothetical protein
MEKMYNAGNMGTRTAKKTGWDRSTQNTQDDEPLGNGMG